ncbi:magnesium transporter MRS2-3 isoform X1 [Cryptomeria japonica]|uniref:magnesium transporter MRS2-3 isoform X1 n=1 Tax=Cryptomeria japonica TaxID=3369 RepID=UPI0027DAA28B|nr:magnesium transporter MRS2-3 isoform X1 [Cryptomeria japonica]XP_057839317.2 magnesium transporter MRS2-3 isoform X1 [Cryptomeria japonica]
MDMELSKLDRANDGEIRQFVDENSFPECPDTKIDDLKVEMNAFNNGPKVLPFEFRALEACLEAACSSLESETVALEGEAYPALDELTSKISTLKLERIRQIKSRLVAISGRVQKVRDELEHLLDDDGDMAEMYLTAKLMQKLDGVCSPTSFPGARGREEHELAHSDAEDESGVEVLNGTFNSLGGDKESSTSSRVHSGTKGLDVEELEMLLEAYFVQIDGTLNKLSVLRGYVDDTEDYINIMLDGKQNHLLQMGVVLTTTTLIISLFVVVAGVMGMNVRISLFNTGFPQWLQIVIGSTISCIFLDIVAIAWFKHKRLV